MEVLFSLLPTHTAPMDLGTLQAQGLKLKRQGHLHSF